MAKSIFTIILLTLALLGASKVKMFVKNNRTVTEPPIQTENSFTATAADTLPLVYEEATTTEYDAATTSLGTQQ